MAAARQEMRDTGSSDIFDVLASQPPIISPPSPAPATPLLEALRAPASPPPPAAQSATRPERLVIAAGGAPPAPPRPPAPAGAAPAPEPDPERLSAAAQAQAGLNRTVSDGALATARAAGANENYLRGVRAVADALLAQGAAQSETDALRTAASGLGTSRGDIEKLFPQAQGAGIDPAGVRAALAGAGLNGRTDAETTRITAEAERIVRTERLRSGLQEAGITSAQARREAQRLLVPPPPEPPRVSTPDEEDGGSGGGGGRVAGLSAGTALRAAGVLTGVGLGLSAAVGVARLVHDAIAGVVDSQLEWERSLTTVHSLYRDLAPTIIGISQAQANLPDTLGTQQEFLQANLNARYLTSRYALPQADTFQLTTAAGRAASTLGLVDQPQREALQGSFLQFAENGGNGLRSIGVEGDPESIARRLGFQSGEALGALTPAQLRQAQEQIAIEGANRFVIGGQDQRGGLLAARTGLEKQLEEARTGLQNTLENIGNNPPPVGPPTPLSTSLGSAGFGTFSADIQSAQIGAPVPAALTAADERSAEQQAAIAAAQEQYAKAIADAQSALDANTAALGDAQKAAADAADQLNKLGVEAGGTTARLLGFAGSLENPASIARADVSAQAQASVASRAIGPNPLVFRSPAELVAQSNQEASQQAYRSFVAPQAQQDLAANDPIRDYLQQQANQQGPGLEDQRQRAQAALAERERRAPADLAVNQATQAQALAGRAQAEAQGQVSSINLVDQQRQLDAAADFARLRGETLDREGGIIDLQRQEADLADRQRVAARENLDLLEQQTRARLDSLQAVNQLNDVQYAQRRDTTEIQAIRADVRRGVLDPSALDRIPDLRQQVRDERLATPRAELQALEGQRPAELAGRAVARDQLNVALREIPLEREQRTLDDRLTPLQQAQRGTDERTVALNRQLEIARLAEEPQRTAAERNVLAATAVALAADNSVRSAQEWAAGIHDGLTDIERAWQLLGSLPQPPTPEPPAAPVTTPAAANPTLNPQQPPLPPPPAPVSVSPPVAPPTQAPPSPAADGGAQVPGVQAPSYQNFPVVASPQPQQTAPPVLTLDDRIGPNRAPRGLTADELDQQYRTTVQAPREAQAAQDQAAVDGLNQERLTMGVNRPADGSNSGPAFLELDALRRQWSEHALTPAQTARAAAPPPPGVLMESAQPVQSLSDLRGRWTETPGQPIGGPSAQSGAGAQVPTTSIENATYNVTVQVTNSNAAAPEIARAVVEALSRRASRSPSATPRTLVGAR